MTVGHKKHLKKLYAPQHWMLDKLSGIWAPKPRAGPHRLRRCLPLVLILRNRLKYALTAKEARMIVSGRRIYVDGKCRTDHKFPCGHQDVISIPQTGENFRMIFDVKGRFHLCRISKKEAHWKLCKVVRKQLTQRGVPIIATHDGRTIRYPDPEVKIGDTIKFDFVNNKILEFVHFKPGQIVIMTGGHNTGRVGVVTKVDKHPGSFDIVRVRDARNHTFATRKHNAFVIGDGTNAWVALPKTQGIRYDIVEEREMRLKKQAEKPQTKRPMNRELRNVKRDFNLTAEPKKGDKFRRMMKQKNQKERKRSKKKP